MDSSESSMLKIIKPPHANGIFVGYIMKMSPRWIDVQNIDERRPWRFYLPWVGGYPEGGGYDPKILTRFKTHEPTDPIRFHGFTKSVHIVSTYDTVRDTTVPFWIGKLKISGSDQDPREVAPQIKNSLSKREPLLPAALLIWLRRLGINHLCSRNLLILLIS